MAELEFHLAQSLKDLRSEINTLWPERDKKSDGWIGDPSHKARVSDHNPDYADGGVVRAIDVDVDGIDLAKLISVIKKDDRTNYYITNGKIYGAEKFLARPYKGSNPHKLHIHISIKHTKAAEKGGSWGLAKAGAGKPATPNKAPKTPTSKPLLYWGVKSSGNAIYKLQKNLNRVFPSYSNFKGDKDFGPYMNQVVKEFQRRSGLKADGVVGDGTWRELAKVGIKP